MLQVGATGFTCGDDAALHRRHLLLLRHLAAQGDVAERDWPMDVGDDEGTTGGEKESNNKQGWCD